MLCSEKIIAKSIASGSFASKILFLNKLGQITSVNHQQYKFLIHSNKLSSSISSNSKMANNASTVDLSKIGQNVVKKVPTMEEVKLETLWAENTIVLTFLRRFGCLFCRQGAKELSTLTPVLAAHNIKLVGVGLEELGVKDFVDGQYFNGDLYVDVGKKTFKDIGYKQTGYLEMIAAFFSKPFRDATAKVRNKEFLVQTRV
jgi:hypothetical protein